MERRAKNYTNFERELLIKLVLAKKGVIENKKTDTNTNQRKFRAWEMICEEFNNSQQSGKRTVKQLKELYQTLKRNARKNNSEVKADDYKIGGETYNLITDIEGNLIENLKTQFKPGSNTYNKSEIFFNEVEDSNSSSSYQMQTFNKDVLAPENRQNHEMISELQQGLSKLNSSQETISSDNKKRAIEEIADIFRKRKEIKNEISVKYLEEKRYNMDLDRKIKSGELEIKLLEKERLEMALNWDKQIKIAQFEKEKQAIQQQKILFNLAQQEAELRIEKLKREIQKL